MDHLSNQVVVSPAVARDRELLPQSNEASLDGLDRTGNPDSPIEPPRSQNSFTALRWIFAIFVVYTHSFALTGKGGSDPLGNLLGRPLSEWGVIGFFIISGFLNSASMHRGAVGNGPASFLLRRAFRILPLLWLTMLIAVILELSIFGVSKAGLVAGFRFWTGNSFLYQPVFQLGQLFASNPITAFCGSIWTLPYEAAFYILIAISGLGRQRGPAWLPHAALAALMCAMFMALPPSVVWFGGIQGYYTGVFGFAFLCGIALMNFKELLQTNAMLVAAFLMMTSSAIFTITTFPGGQMLQIVGFGVLVLRIGQANLGAISRWAERWDASYGIYLLSFPIQQALIAHGVHKPYKLFLISTLIASVAGIISWNYLEKPMAAMGKRLSRRLLQARVD